MKTVNVKSLGSCPYLISLQPDDLIGHGSYAEVYRGYNKKDSSEKLAIKIFDMSHAKKIESAYRELMIVMELPRHENLVEYKKIKVSSKNRIYVIMEECQFSLKTKLKQQQMSDFPEAEVWNFLSEFVAGYKILNKKQIIHRDIKPDNILIGYDGRYKISDFGLAEIVSEIRKDRKINGTLGYLAPELIDGNNVHINNLNDVYSLGVCCFEMCFGKWPYLRNLGKLYTIGKFISQVKFNSLVFPQNHSYSSELINLISSMLEKTQSKRCSWQYIFYIVMQKSPNNKNSLMQLQHCVLFPAKKFRIVQISDTLLKNLSNLDKDVYSSLNNQSIVVIDHVEAEIIWKRLIVFYCDRVQFRLGIIGEKEKIGEFRQFMWNLLLYTYLQSECLDKCFENYYEKLEKSELIKIIGSHKYLYIRNLIKQDYLSLKAELQQLISPQQLTQFLSKQQSSKNVTNQNSKQKNTINNNNNDFPLMSYLQTQIYSECFTIILKLYEYGYYEQCKQIDELEIWLEDKDRNQGVITKMRKNQNCLKEFDQQICGIEKEKLKQIVTQTYVYYFNLIDKK